MPAATKKNSSIRARKSFQRMITPQEMRVEMKRINRTEKASREFLKEIGVVFKKNGKIEVKSI